MKIVIDLPENVYYDTFQYVESLASSDFELLMMRAIKNGTPLPKGHGRLKDENEIKRMIEEAKVNGEYSKTFAENIIRFASTIIDADKESD